MRLNKDKLINLALSNGILICIIILIIVTGLIQPEFFAWSNMINILRQISVNGIVACGMTVCIMSGCYDLSVGSMLSLIGGIGVVTFNATNSIIVTLLAVLAMGALLGFFNGSTGSSCFFYELCIELLITCNERNIHK